MASAADVRDIMGMAPQDNTITRDQILGTDKKKSKKSAGNVFQRPEGMHRELYNLLYSENKDLPCPLIQTDTSKDLGYKQMRAKLGMKKVRSWKWMPFTNPARKDGLILYHWRRTQDEGKDYPFARFNKVCHNEGGSSVQTLPCCSRWLKFLLTRSWNTIIIWSPVAGARKKLII
jgi:DNA methyltransferase 1-associated protein 1